MAVALPLKVPGFDAALKCAVNKKSHRNMLLPGLMLGFLPCGLPFAAFAAGTLPGLLLLETGASRLAVRYRTYSDMLSATLMIGMAAFLFVDAFGAIVGK
jgi:sulfite exporter TauE/SafE